MTTAIENRFEQQFRIHEIVHNEDKNTWRLTFDYVMPNSRYKKMVVLYNINPSYGVGNFEEGQDVLASIVRASSRVDGDPNPGHPDEYWWNLERIQAVIETEADEAARKARGAEADARKAEAAEGQPVSEKYDIYLVSQSQRIAFDGINIGNLKPPQGRTYDDMTNEEIIEWGYYLRDLIIHHSLDNGVRTPEQWAAHFTHTEAQDDYMQIAEESEAVAEAFHATVAHLEEPDPEPF